jgi:hypothetical protein
MPRLRFERGVTLQAVSINFLKSYPRLRVTFTWLPYLFIAVAVLAAVLWFLYQAPAEVPMGDSYIHFVYARNLALHGRFAFNPAVEEGVGTTSALWVFLLAGFIRLGFDVVLVAKVLGVLLLVSTGLLLYNTLVRTLPSQLGDQAKLLATAVALLAVLPGNMIWIALSGMETVLFMFLAVLAINLYFRKQWLWAGISLGLLALTRIEGPVLAAAILLIELVRHRRITREMVKLALPVALLLLPWMLYLQVREGVPFPTSYEGKLLVFEEAGELVSEEFPGWSWLLEANPILFIAGWLGYIFLYAVGGAALPGPVYTLNNPGFGALFSVPWVGLLVVLLIVVPLFILALRYIWIRRNRLVLEWPHHRFLAVFLLWTILHNLLYAAVLPQPGAAGRYIPMNQWLLWFLLFAGVLAFPFNRFRFIPGLLLVGLVSFSLYYWHGVYAANIHYMHAVRLAAVRYINRHVPSGEPVGVSDLGPAGYYVDRSVVDLVGFVNRDILDYLDNGGSYADYLRREGISYLLLFDSLDDQAGEFARYSEITGLADDPRVELIVEQTYSVPFEEWRRGNAAVRNYMPALSVVRLEWR